MHLIIDSIPLAKQRHRSFIRNGKIMVFDKQSSDKNNMKSTIRANMLDLGLQILPDSPIYVGMTNYIPIPKSLTVGQKKRLEGKLCIKKPDVDNYIKFYFDVLNEIAYSDDRLIAQLWAEKRYSSHPRVELTIEPIGEWMINEHAVTVTGEITLEDLNYMIKKANRIGKSQREIVRVFTQEDNEGKHIYFEVESIKAQNGFHDV